MPAPLDINSIIIRVWPFSTAICNGVSPNYNNIYTHVSAQEGILGSSVSSGLKDVVRHYSL